MFSLDVAALIADLSVGFFPATPDATPKLLFEFTAANRRGHGQFFGLDLSPDNKIWASGRRNVMVFDGNDGHFLFSVEGDWTDSMFGTSCDRNDEIFITDRWKGRIVVCNSDGRVARQIKLQFRPRAIATNGQGLLAVACDDQLHVLRRDGSVVTSFGGRGSGGGMFRDVFRIAYGVAMSSNGEIVVADQYDHCIHVFDVNGKFIRQFGSKGSAAGQLSSPISVAVDGAGNFVVCDQQNHRVQIFKSDGTFINQFGAEFLSGFSRDPFHVCVNTLKRIVVLNADRRKVKVFAFQ